MPHALKIRGAWLAATSLAALLAACSTSASKEQIALGTASIDAAQGAGAGEPGQADLTLARDKLARAQAAARSGDKVTAKRLAEEADVDAQAARTKVGSDKSRKAAAELDASIATLRDELSRTAAPR
jgi:uncharacterized small protein (DUF1192 family)